MIITNDLANSINRSVMFIMQVFKETTYNIFNVDINDDNNKNAK